MKIMHFMSVALLSALLLSCNTPTPDPVVPDPEKQDSLVLKGEVFPMQSSCTHVQPMTGLVFWPGNEKMGQLQEAISLEFSYCLPCKVVKGKTGDAIQYDWTYFENILNDMASRKHQAVIRFRYEYPSSRDVDGEKGTTAVPQYIKDLPDYEETYSANPGGDGPTYYADWSNEELMWFTKQFYTDFNARYAGDSRIAYLEVGFGHWSEYHIWGTSLKFGKNFPTKAYQKEFFQHLNETMNIPWLVSIDAGDSQYFGFDSDVQKLTFGLFDDSFMHKEHDKSQGDGFNEQCWQWSDAKGNRWHTGVNGGEVSYYTSNDQKNFLDPNGMYGVTWEQAAAKYHITFMNTNDVVRGSFATKQRMTEAALASGYRFAVLDARADDKEVTLLVTNQGVAPIYYDAYFAIAENKSDISLKGLLPGEKKIITLPRKGNTLPTIVCDHILPGQEIQYDAAVK